MYPLSIANLVVLGLIDCKKSISVFRYTPNFDHSNPASIQQFFSVTASKQAIRILSLAVSRFIHPYSYHLIDFAISHNSKDRRNNINARLLEGLNSKRALQGDAMLVIQWLVTFANSIILTFRILKLVDQRCYQIEIIISLCIWSHLTHRN
jgi:hypothetical protein